MRLLAGLGAMLFLYLAVIPAGLVYSTIESACEGSGCDTPPLARIGLVAMYSVCLVAILGTAGLFARHAARGTVETQSRLIEGLRLSAVVIGGALFVLFAIAAPLGAAIALAAAISGYLLISRRRPPSGRGDAGGNGHRELNGQSTNGHVSGKQILRPPRP